MLIGADEAFNHQAPLPHAVVASSDPAWRERYWISLQDTVRQHTMLTCGLGKYPNQNVLEGFVCVVHDGVQRNVRMSQAIAGRPDSMSVGPWHIEIVKPFEELRLVLDENPSGIALNVTWHGEMTPSLEDRHFEVSRGRIVHDLVRYVQHGRASGTVQTPTASLTLDAAEWWGERDHSWGVRPIPAGPGAPPGVPPEWRFLMFLPVQFETFAVHIYLYETADGRPLHLSAAICGRQGEPLRSDVVVGIHHDLTWDEQAPVLTLVGGGVRLELASGEVLDIDLNARPARAYLRGGGYQLDHGQWKGEEHLEHDVYDQSDADVIRKIVMASSDHFLEATCRGERGFGIMEYVVRRSHQRYGGAATPSARS